MSAEDPSEGGPLGERPGADPIARAVRRSRVENALFATDEQVRIGRYQLLEKVGAGGIGVVWGAWDPELERRVAIKLIKPTIEAARDRILFEGQALAKLAHPNVVAVHDVGIYDDQVYLVMEWVRGENLRAYCAKPRSVRELLEIYRAAGEGLFAAHRAGVIHRDFKPDNAMRGDDGRVRVLDFGLAGTPLYMAPEQRARTTVTPAADQYAFCVSLREALGIVPRWLDVILATGTAEEPAERYPSMGELLRALARDPATVWRRRGIAGAAIAGVGAAFVVGNLMRDEIEPCVGGAETIAKTWNPSVRDKVVTHLRSLGAYGAEEAVTLADDMARYGGRWATTHRETCVANERHEMTPTIYERNLGCLARARVSYETVVEVLATTTPERLSSAIDTARSLPAVDRCAFESASSTVMPPAKEIAPQVSVLAAAIERGRVLALTDHPGAIDATRAAATGAEALHYAPLVARAYLASGLALVRQERTLDAIPILDSAVLAALDAFDDITFVEAYAREIYAISVVPKDPAHERALGAVSYVEHVALRSGEAGASARALFFNNLGASHLATGKTSEARALFDRSMKETARERDAELVAAVANRALVTEAPAEREKLFAEARATLTRLLGANHRKTLDVRIQAALFIEDEERVTTELRELCELYERYHATVAPLTLDQCVIELAWLAEARGDVAEARAALGRLRVNEGPVREIADAYVLMLDGKLGDAAATAHAVAEKYKSESWARLNAADALLFAALAEEKLRRRDTALASTRASLALYEQLTFMAAMPYYRRRVERARALLARVTDSR